MDGSFVRVQGQVFRRLLVIMLNRSIFQAVKNQMDQDEYIKNLAESLREMIGVAQECPDLSTIPGTTNVIDDIGRTCLNVASLIQEYTTSRFLSKRDLFLILSTLVYSWYSGKNLEIPDI